VLLEAVDFRAHDGIRLPFAWPPEAFENHHGFDVIHAHATSPMMHWAPMMRALHGIPCIATNTIHLPSFAQHVLPEALFRLEPVRRQVEAFAPAVEAAFTRSYNAGDGLIVQCAGLAQYWRDFGLQVPLHIIARPIDTAVFDTPAGPDPFPADFGRGGRIIAVGRHAREKDLHKLVEAFAAHILPVVPSASLTLVGDGMEHRRLKQLAERLGVGQRVAFPGELPHAVVRQWYGHADLFAYASMSETYGQVISEALWCGTPVVALNDRMGIAFQVTDGKDGLLVEPGQGELERLGNACASLLLDEPRRRAMGADAAVRARQRVSPDAVYAQYEAAYEAAILHRRTNPPPQFRPFQRQSWQRVFDAHLAPWTVLQLIAAGSGMFRSGKSDYEIPRGVDIGALPTAAADTVPQTSTRPQHHRPLPRRAPTPMWRFAAG
jgi:glycosyltransferase involved in cell wall biosynthesis